jgi:hypothetical protein
MRSRDLVCAIFADQFPKMRKVRIYLSLVLLASATACGPAYGRGSWDGAYGCCGPGYLGPLAFHDRFHGERFVHGERFFHADRFHGGGFHGGGFHGGGHR